MIITDAQIQELAQRFDVRNIAQALGIPATDVAKDILKPIVEPTMYQPIRCVSSLVYRYTQISVWVVMWQCQAMPHREGYTYLRTGMSLN